MSLIDLILMWITFMAVFVMGGYLGYVVFSEIGCTEVQCKATICDCVCARTQDGYSEYSNKDDDLFGGSLYD